MEKKQSNKGTSVVIKKPLNETLSTPRLDTDAAVMPPKTKAIKTMSVIVAVLIASTGKAPRKMPVKITPSLKFINIPKMEYISLW